MSQYDCEFTEKVTCPFCGHEDDESYEHNDSDGDETECGCCGEAFYVSADVSVTYTTKCKTHDYLPKPTAAHPDKVECDRCGEINFRRYLEPEEVAALEEHEAIQN